MNRGGDIIIVALNGDLERTLISQRSEFGDIFYCQLCGDPVYPAVLKEAQPKRKRSTRYTQNLEQYIPVRKEMNAFFIRINLVINTSNARLLNTSQ